MYWVQHANEDSKDYFKRIRKPDIKSVNAADAAPDAMDEEFYKREGTLESIDHENWIDPDIMG